MGLNVEHVQCFNVQTEIWNRLSAFENQHDLKNFLKGRVQSLRNKNGLFEGCSDNRSLNNFGLINNEDITEELLIRITNTAKQAREFYFSSINLPLLSKPILLIYTLEKLSELLALCTFNIPFTEKKMVKNADNKDTEVEREKRYPHGVSYYDGVIRIKTAGFYHLFHDSFSNDSDIYTKSHEFTLEGLLRFGALDVYRKEYNCISYAELFEVMKTKDVHFKVNIKNHKTNTEISLHELDREFLFMYAISTLARYKVKEWSVILDGKENEMVLKIQEYIQTIEAIFPNIILDYLLDKVFLFVPLGYLQKEDVKKILKDGRF